MRKIKNSRLQNIALSLLTIFVCGTALEFIFYLQTKIEWQPEKIYSGNLHRGDSELGYGPNAGIYTAKNIVTRLTRNEVAYRATYTISEKYLRKTPEVDYGAACTAVFLGGSVTFGEGVNDNETMPFYFTKASEGKFSTYNFGFMGYGPHQMLRTLETDRFTNIVSEPVDIFLYQGIDGHVQRAVGMASWDKFGPSYVVGEDGILRYRGPFHHETFKTFNNILQKSFLYLFLKSTFSQEISISDDDVDTYIEIVKKARALVEEKYQSKFVVLFWDNNSELSTQIVHELKKNQFDVILITEIIPDINSIHKSYVLSPHDSHPNPAVYKLTGEYLAEQFKDTSCSNG